MQRALFYPVLLVVLLTGGAVHPPVIGQTRAASVEPVVIPFELVGRHVIVSVTVNDSRPLSFVLDTGAHVAIIRTDTARELGLKLEGTVSAGGAGPGKQTGSFVRGAKWSLAGLANVSQPITLALPLPELPPALGRRLDGIIGGEFIREFVVEVDYQEQRLRIHQPDSFAYTGPGEALPVEFVNISHPTIPATVTPVGGAPIEGRFMFDIGAGLALALHSPFVKQHQLPGSDLNTIRAHGGAGAGGRTAGRFGRIESLRIGSFALARPITMFSEDQAGAFANPALAGNIGAQVAMRFRVYLDYRRRRIILEPTSRLAEPFDRAFSGLVVRAYGEDFRTFRVTEVIGELPAAKAGIREGDVITAVDDVSAERLTLQAINDMLEKPVRRALTIRRGDQTISVALTPERLI